jgi:FG-GAP repeat
MKYKLYSFGILVVTVFFFITCKLINQGNIESEGDILNGQGILHASNLQPYDLFGSSVSISGDYAIVGAIFGSGSVSGTGAAYIFKINDTYWSEEAILHTSDLQGGDRFGTSVSISGDYAIVGASFEDGGRSNPATEAGAAYIFKRNGTNWSEEAILRASDLQSPDFFGNSVSISGDYAIVGAHYEAGGNGDPATSAGAAYIFKRNGTSWSEETILHASDIQEYDFFGTSVSISGDYVIVGADSEDGGNGSHIPVAGAAYIFKRSGSSWLEESILHASDLQSGDSFGGSVSISGDYAIVGASFEGGGSGDPARGAGAAYIFKRSGISWFEESILHASDLQGYDGFGVSVSISGDYAIVGAWLEDGGNGDPATEAGAAYIFKRNGTDWSEERILHASDLQSGDYLGGSVSISGDYAIVGADWEDGGQGDPVPEAGAAYLFNH